MPPAPRGRARAGDAARYRGMYDDAYLPALAGLAPINHRLPTPPTGRSPLTRKEPHVATPAHLSRLAGCARRRRPRTYRARLPRTWDGGPGTSMNIAPRGCATSGSAASRQSTWLGAEAQVGPVWMEVPQPLEGESPFSEWLARHGDGVHHIGYEVETSDAATDLHTSLRATGRGARVGVVRRHLVLLHGHQAHHHRGLGGQRGGSRPSARTRAERGARRTPLADRTGRPATTAACTPRSPGARTPVPPVRRPRVRDLLLGQDVFSHMAVEDFDALIAAFADNETAQRWEESFVDAIHYPNADPQTGWPERMHEVWLFGSRPPREGARRHHKLEKHSRRTPLRPASRTNPRSDPPRAARGHSSRCPPRPNCSNSMGSADQPSAKHSPIWCTKGYSSAIPDAERSPASQAWHWA